MFGMYNYFTHQQLPEVFVVSSNFIKFVQIHEVDLVQQGLILVNVILILDLYNYFTHHRLPEIFEVNSNFIKFVQILKIH